VSANRDNRSPAENGTGILGAMTGFGIVSFGLFLLPLLPLAIAAALIGAILAAPFLAFRAIRRRRAATTNAVRVYRFTPSERNL
jgi:hypothetical protein